MIKFTAAIICDRCRDDFHWESVRRMHDLPNKVTMTEIAVNNGWSTVYNKALKRKEILCPECKTGKY